jgi:hypothetical protein
VYLIPVLFSSQTKKSQSLDLQINVRLLWSLVLLFQHQSNIRKLITLKRLHQVALADRSWDLSILSLSLTVHEMSFS